MILAPGTKLGPYEIGPLLGAGGMGEVYRARDGRLARDVALKILPESFARDQDRLRRFEQETHAVAALNHPNILAIHDVGHYNGSPFLVSELLEGKSMRAALEHGALPQRKVIEYGVQIAQGLAAAHEKGVVHRDLKPENLFITKDDRVKILDFGLAKLAAMNPLPDGATLTSSHTAAGTVMGTASYMAPEQVRGEPTDPRTDIFAFGAVLFEMLSGERAFGRDTTAETMTAVLKADPPELSHPQHPISPALDRIVRRCLEKNPEQRFQSARDLSFALSALSGSDASSAVRLALKPRKTPLLLWASIPVLLVAVAATWLFAKSSRPAAEPLQFAIPASGEGEVSHMALSADGNMLAFVSPDEKTAEPILHIQRVGSSTATVIAGSEGASYPFWSPDHEYLAFFANGKLQKVASSGGAPQTLASVSTARGGSWGSKNVIVYAPEAPGVLWRVNADGSGAAVLTAGIAKPGEGSHRWPVFLPDGDHFLFWAGNFGNAKDDRISGIYLSSLAAKDKQLVVLAHSNIGFGGGHLIYADDRRQLVAIPFDVTKGTVSGEPHEIAGLVGFHPSTYWGAFAVAENGTVVYNTSAQAASSALTWVDRSGKERGRVTGTGVMANPTLSPAGDRVAVDITDEKANNVDVWLQSLEGGGNARFTFDPAEEGVGVWSRDGKTIVYRMSAAGMRGSGMGLFLKPVSGLEREKPLVILKNLRGQIYPNSWTPDSKQILCTTMGDESGSKGQRSNLVLFPVGGGDPVPFLTSTAALTNGQISPDGKWVAYASNESGAWEIYVTTFPNAAGKWQVSRGGGTEPRWRGDSKEIFYIATTGMMMAVPLASEGTFSTGTPAALFQVYGRAQIAATDVFTYDVTSDGKRFLVNRYVKPDRVTPLTIVLNATAGDTR